MSFLSPRIDLFKFTETGSGRVYRLTNHNKSAFIGTEEYTPIAITRTNVVHSQELEKTIQEITLPLTNEMARRWLQRILFDTITVTLFEQRGENTRALWHGNLSSISPSETSISLQFVDRKFALQKKGQGISYTRNCRHQLYSPECGVSTKPLIEINFGWGTFSVPSPYVFNATVTTAVGSTLSISPLVPGDDLTGGHLEAEDGSYSTIIKHYGEEITLLRPNKYLLRENSNKRVTLYVGCRKTIEDCKTRFNNVENFGGFPWIPNIGLFDGKPIMKS